MDYEWKALAALRAARDFIQTVTEDADQRRVLKRVNDAIASIERNRHRRRLALKLKI